MTVAMLSIARDDAKVCGPDEVVYAVKVAIDGQDRTFEVLVTGGTIGSHRVPYATFRDSHALEVFRHDQRPITDILRRVLDAYNREQAMSPA